MGDMELNGKKHNELFQGIVGFITLILSIILFFRFLVDGFNSDYANVIKIGRDAIAQYSITPDWFSSNEIMTLPTIMPAPYFGLLYYLTGNSWLSYVIVMIFLMALLVISFGYMLHATGISLAYLPIGSAMMIPAIFWPIYVIFPITSCFLIGVIFSSSPGRHSFVYWSLRILVMLIAFSQGYGTVRTTVNLYIPLLLWALFPMFYGIATSKKHIFSLKEYSAPRLLTVLVSCSNLAALLISRFYPLIALNTASGIVFEKLNYDSLNNLPSAAWDILTADSTGFLKGVLLVNTNGVRPISFSSFHFILVMLLFAMIAGILFLSWNTLSTYDRPKEVLILHALFFIMPFSAMCLFPIMRIGGFRYLYTALPLLSFSVVMVASILKRRKFNYWPVVIIVFLIAVSRIGMYSNAIMSLPRDLLSPPFKQTALVFQDYLEKHSLSRGFASYWNAAQYTLACDESVIFADLQPFNAWFKLEARYATSPKWYFTPKFAEKNVFLLLTTEEEKIAMDNPDYKDLFSAATKLEDILGFHVYLWKDCNPFIDWGLTFEMPPDAGNDFQKSQWAINRTTNEHAKDFGDLFTIFSKKLTNRSACSPQDVALSSNIMFNPNKPDVIVAKFAKNIQTHVGVRSKFSLSSNGTQGFLAIGPYVPIYKGKYIIQITGNHGKIEESYIDISSEMGTKIWFKAKLSEQKYNSEDGVLGRFSFSLPEDLSDCEFRIWVGSGDDVEFVGYTVIPDPS